MNALPRSRRQNSWKSLNMTLLLKQLRLIIPQRPLGARKPRSEHVSMMARNMILAYQRSFLVLFGFCNQQFISILDALWSGESSVVARLHLQQYLGDLEDSYDWNITNGADFARVVTCNSLTYLSFQKFPKKIHLHEAKKPPRLMKKHDCNPWYSTEVKVWSLGYEIRFRTLDVKTATPAREDEFWREVVFIPNFQSGTKDLTFKSSDESKG